MTFWIVVLFCVGIALLFTEFFTPGLILGATGVTCIVASAVLAVIYYPDSAFFIILTELLGVVCVVAGGMYILPRSRFGKALVMQGVQQLDEGYVAADTDASLVGSLAEVVTALRPAGTIRVRNQRVTAVSNGEFIGEGVTVRVTEVHGSRVVVEQAQPD